MAGAATLTYVFMSRPNAAAALPPGCAVSSSSSNLPGEPTHGYHSQAGMFPLLPFRALGQPPKTMGKVMGPRLPSVVQRARNEADSRSLQLEDRTQDLGVTNSQARAIGYQAIGQALCQIWHRHLREAPLSLPPRSQGLAR